MNTPDKVNPQITDPVTQTNIKATTETPASAIEQAMNSTTIPTLTTSAQAPQNKNNAAGNNTD